MSHLCVRRRWSVVLVYDLEDTLDLGGGEEVGVLLLGKEVGEGQEVEGEV